MPAMKGPNLLSCGIILLTIVLMSGTVTGARYTPTPTVDYAEIQAFNSVNDASLALYAGQNALQAGRYEEALVQYTRTTELDPSWMAAWYLKAYSLVKLNRSEEALTAVDQALVLESSDRDSNNLKGEILENLGRRNEAANYRRTPESSSPTTSAPVPVTTVKKSPLHPATIVIGFISIAWIGRKHGKRPSFSGIHEKKWVNNE